MKNRSAFGIATSLALVLLSLSAATDGQAACLHGHHHRPRGVLENPTVFNRLGAQNPNWITFALRRDVIDLNTGLPEAAGGTFTPGKVALRPDKRTRPMVLRSVAGQCLTVNFQNLLAPVANPNNAIQDALINDDQVAGRCASFHASGTELVDSMTSDGSMVGNNHPGDDVFANCGPNAKKGGLVGPGSITHLACTPTRRLRHQQLRRHPRQRGQQRQPRRRHVRHAERRAPGSRIYRSQVTEEELRLATTGDAPAIAGASGSGGQPIIDYEALYPNVEPWISEGKAGLPILKMLTAANELVHSDINAIIAGSNADGSFPPSTYPLESVGKNVPSSPTRLEPFREFTSVFHDEQTNSQAFPRWYNNPVLSYTLAGVKDQFMINYASGGIGSEIIANRLHTGPMHDCTGCAYEEFFLSSTTVGDPAMLVQFPANSGIEQCDPDGHRRPDMLARPGQPGQRADPGNYALFQEDPPTYTTPTSATSSKIRNIHAVSFEQTSSTCTTTSGCKIPTTTTATTWTHRR
jgi:hypothetical protein